MAFAGEGEAEGRLQFQWDPSRTREVVGGAQRENSKRTFEALGHESGQDLVDGAVTATRDDPLAAEARRLCGEPTCVPRFPGHAHLDLEVVDAHGFHRLAQILVLGLLAVQHDARLHSRVLTALTLSLRLAGWLTSQAMAG